MPVAQLDRVPGYEPGGREFESLRARIRSVMKCLYILSGLLFSGLYAACVQETMSPAQQQQYVRSGTYQQDIATSTERFNQDVLHWEMKTKPSGPLSNFVMVFDVDETLLSNMPYLMSAGFEPCVQGFYQSLGVLSAEPIEPVLKMLKSLAHKGYRVVILTARRAKYCDLTKRQLGSVGLTQSDYDQLFCNDTNLDPVPFKRSIIQRYRQQGLQVVMNVSDQCAELADKAIPIQAKLPNPFYKIVTCA